MGAEACNSSIMIRFAGIESSGMILRKPIVTLGPSFVTVKNVDNAANKIEC